MTEWRYLKEIILAKELYPQYSQDDHSYFIKLYDGTVLIDECVLLKNLNHDDVYDFEMNFKPLSNQRLGQSVVIKTTTKTLSVASFVKQYSFAFGVKSVIIENTGQNSVEIYFDDAQRSDSIVIRSGQRFPEISVSGDNTILNYVCSSSGQLQLIMTGV